MILCAGSTAAAIGSTNPSTDIRKNCGVTEAGAQPVVNNAESPRAAKLMSSTQPKDPLRELGRLRFVSFVFSMPPLASNPHSFDDGKMELHAGLIMIVPNVGRSIQHALFEAAVLDLAGKEPIQFRD